MKCLKTLIVKHLIMFHRRKTSTRKHFHTENDNSAKNVLDGIFQQVLNYVKDIVNDVQTAIPVLFQTSGKMNQSKKVRQFTSQSYSNK